MKKLIICIAIFNLFELNAFAQTGWFFQNPLPTTNSIQSMSFIDENTGFIVGDCNTIAKTTNGGTTWLQQNTQFYNYYNSVQFINAETGFVAGNVSILKTTNGGGNWFSVSNGATSIYFIDNNTGYAQKWNYLVIKTTDGGNS